MKASNTDSSSRSRQVSWGFRILFSCCIAVLAILHLRETGGNPGGASATIPPQTGNLVAGADEPVKGGERVLSPEDLAKERGVPALVADPQGDYTLVSVIEGAESNQRLTESLQLVALQRKELASLAQEFEELPVSAVQQRELLAGKINEGRNMLGANLQFMAKSYGYSINNNYVRVPHHVLMIGTTTDGDEVTSELVHEFQTAEDYLEFQEKNNAYLRVKMDLAKAGEGNRAPDAIDAAGEDGAAPEIAANTEISGMRDELMKTYHFDPERQYRLQHQKTALYARAAK